MFNAGIACILRMNHFLIGDTSWAGGRIQIGQKITINIVYGKN